MFYIVNAFVQDTRLGRLTTVLGPEALVLMLFNGALLRKSDECGASPFLGQTYPAGSVTGVPRAVQQLRTAMRI